MSALVFLGVAGFVALALGVSRITGARCHYIEDWKPDEGEHVLFEDREADVYLVPELGQARFTSYARLRRGFALVTNRGIVAGQRALFSRKSMIQYMIYSGQAPGQDSQALGGGQLTRGYQTLVLEPGAIQWTTEGSKPFVELTPSPAVRSSFNLQAIRIYTDDGAQFPLPEPSAEAQRPAAHPT